MGTRRVSLYYNAPVLTLSFSLQIMDQLRLDEGAPIRIWGGRYPKGKLIKIQAQSVDFLEISDPKAVCVTWVVLDDQLNLTPTFAVAVSSKRFATSPVSVPATSSRLDIRV